MVREAGAMVEVVRVEEGKEGKGEGLEALREGRAVAKAARARGTVAGGKEAAPVADMMAGDWMEVWVVVRAE